MAFTRGMLTAGVLAASLIMGLAGRVYAGIAVSPLKQEISLKPGESGKITIGLSYNNRLPTDVPQKVGLALMDVVAMEDGALTFREGGSVADSASKWVTIEGGNLVMEPGTSRPLECRITVPESAQPGEYYTALMVTMGTQGVNEKGVSVQYRIASGIFVTVQGRTFPKEARIARCELLWPEPPAATAPATQPAEEERTQAAIQVLLQNTGRARFDATGRLLVLDDQMRIVAVSTMTSRRPTVFAGDSRLFEAPITKALAPGKYTMRVEMDYQSSWAKARQDLRVDLLPEQAALLGRLRQGPHATALVEATPETLLSNIPPGATRSMAVTVKNVSDGDVTCKAVVTAGGGTGITVQPEQFTIARGSRKTLEVRVVSDAATDRLSALISLEAQQEGGGHSELSIPVDIQQKMER